MRILQIIVLLSILFFGCAKQEKQETNIDELIETPETLETTESYSLKSSRYKGNIIDILFKEAMSKDENLKELNDRIKEISTDSLGTKTNEYLKYKNVNSRYWTAAKNYTNNLTDSLVRIEMLDAIEKLEHNYNKRVAKHEGKMDSIESLKLMLKDNHILIKLLISRRMIQNYQTNELPNINQLKSLIKDYKTTIEDLKKYSKIKK